MGGLVQDHGFIAACTPCSDAAAEVEEAPSMSIAVRHQGCSYTPAASSATEHRSGETATELAARLLAEAPERDWRLRDLATLVHLSTSQLGRAFTQRFGMPPMRYLAHIRAHRLAELLVETDLPIGVAMTHVGWHSRGYAAQQFTAIVGMSPSSYRRTAIARSRTGTSQWPSAAQGSPES
ncbi:helix-turn-helix transcriptional regulator [Kytococcus sedentarius]|uniref:helix-turn-helix transcriptional regulator n=2 Tax=Kytococcus sedentarius TaxID=1276 RepID=UPI0009D6D1C7